MHSRLTPLACLFFALISALPLSAALLLQDDFSDPNLSVRRAQRGSWHFEDGAGICTQDDDLFKKSKDHGPILFYNLAYADATIRFAFRSQGTKSLIFTANGADGHVFRFVIGQNSTSIRGFPPHGESHSISLGQEKFVLHPGEWTSVEVILKGDTATVKLGDEPAYTYTHPSLDRPKTNLSIGFSYGTVSVRNLVVMQ